MVAWLTRSPGVPGSRPVVTDIFPWCTHVYAVTQTVQIRGIIMTSEQHITDSRRTKNVPQKIIKMTNMSMVTCKRSIKPFINRGDIVKSDRDYSLRLLVVMMIESLRYYHNSNNLLYSCLTKFLTKTYSWNPSFFFNRDVIF